MVRPARRVSTGSEKTRTPKEYGELYEKFLGSPELSAAKPRAETPENWFVKFAKTSSQYVNASDKFEKEEYKNALAFLEWKVTPKEVNAAPVFGLMLSLIPVVPLVLFLLYSIFYSSTISFTIGLYMVLPLVLVPFFVIYYLQGYLIAAAEREKVTAITSIPEIVNYLVMSMKLSPNLEKAVSFAAEHGKGKIAESFKRLAWDIQVGTFRTIEEGLDDLAYKWGRYSDEFKHALMLIRSSVIEVDEAKRAAILDRAVADVLEGVRDDMSRYATEMRQPSIYLYYVGVLLPLMLIIMLPIGSVMANLPFAQTWIMILLYNILIPVGTVFFARNILEKRPQVYVPPMIPDDHPGLPQSGNMRVGTTEMPAWLAGIATGVLVFAVFYFILEPLLNPIPRAFNPDAVKV